MEVTPVDRLPTIAQAAAPRHPRLQPPPPDPSKRLDLGILAILALRYFVVLTAIGLAIYLGFALNDIRTRSRAVRSRNPPPDPNLPGR